MIESQGVHSANFMVTVTRRGEYVVSINHFFEDAYHELLERTGELPNRDRFEHFDAVASRLLFEAVGLTIVTADVEEIWSSLDACRRSRELQGWASGIDDMCVVHECNNACHFDGCPGAHIHTDACLSNGVLVCGRFHLCVGISCTYATAYHARVRNGEPPGLGVRGNVNTIWIGHETAWGDRVNVSAATSGGGTIYMRARRRVGFTGSNNDIYGVFLHEIGHILSAPDHVHANFPGTDDCASGIFCPDPTCNPDMEGRRPRRGACIMQTSRPNNITSMHGHDVFCNECIEDMKNFLRENIDIFDRGN